MSSDPEMMLFFVVKLLHVAAMAIFFGSSLGTAGAIRDAASTPLPHTDRLVARIQRRTQLTGFGAMTTLLTGLLLVGMSSGFRAVPLRIGIGFVLMLVLAAIGAGGIGGLWRKMKPEIAAGNGAAIAPALGRLAFLEQCHLFVFFLILVCMIVPFG